MRRGGRARCDRVIRPGRAPHRRRSSWLARRITEAPFQSAVASRWSAWRVTLTWVWASAALGLELRPHDRAGAAHGTAELDLDGSDLDLDGALAGAHARAVQVLVVGLRAAAPRPAAAGGTSASPRRARRARDARRRPGRATSTRMERRCLSSRTSRGWSKQEASSSRQSISRIQLTSWTTRPP